MQKDQKSIFFVVGGGMGGQLLPFWEKEVEINYN